MHVFDAAALRALFFYITTKINGNTCIALKTGYRRYSYKPLRYAWFLALNNTTTIILLLPLQSHAGGATINQSAKPGFSINIYITLVPAKCHTGGAIINQSRGPGFSI